MGKMLASGIIGAFAAALGAALFTVAVGLPDTVMKYIAKETLGHISIVYREGNMNGDHNQFEAKCLSKEVIVGGICFNPQEGAFLKQVGTGALHEGKADQQDVYTCGYQKETSAKIFAACMRVGD
jgi:hypothetical protein